MHASIDELLSLRDGEAIGEPSARHVRECPACETELARLRRVRSELAGLPDLAPPPGVWAKIQAAPSRQESRGGRWRRAVFAAGIAASVTLAALLLVREGGREAVEQPVTATARSQPAESTPDTRALVQRSRELETVLKALEYEPRLVNIGTASTIAVLEDSLALVDYQLSLTADRELPPQRSHELWQRRVDLMGSLVNVRYAQQLQQVTF